MPFNRAHPDVGQHKIEGFGPDQIPRLLTTQCRNDFVLFRLQKGCEHAENARFVIDQ